MNGLIKHMNFHVMFSFVTLILLDIIEPPLEITMHKLLLDLFFKFHCELFNYINIV
jgi:hypothetical protein